MISYKKHSIVYLLLFVMMLVQFASCSPQNSEASLSGISINSSQSSSNSQSLTSVQSKSVTYSNATIEDVPTTVLPNGGYIYENEEKVYLEELQNGEPDYYALVDNNTALEELLKKNDNKVPADKTLNLTCSYFNTVWYRNPTAYTYNLSVNWLQILTGVEISFTRTVGEFYDELRSEQATRMYTVLESEMGGYIYCFFNYYPKSNYTILRCTIYLPKPMTYEEISTIKEGDHIDNLTQIAPLTLYIQRLIKDNVYSIYNNVIPLSNHTTAFISYDDSGIVNQVKLLEGNIRRNPWLKQYYTVEDGVVGDENSPWNIYDFTILPQDYPPA